MPHKKRLYTTTYVQIRLWISENNNAGNATTFAWCYPVFPLIILSLNREVRKPLQLLLQLWKLSSSLNHGQPKIPLRMRADRYLYPLGGSDQSTVKLEQARQSRYYILPSEGGIQTQSERNVVLTLYLALDQSMQGFPRRYKSSRL